MRRVMSDVNIQALNILDGSQHLRISAMRLLFLRGRNRAASQRSLEIAYACATHVQQELQQLFFARLCRQRHAKLFQRWILSFREAVC